jgi:hypothetical protein
MTGPAVVKHLNVIDEFLSGNGTAGIQHPKILFLLVAAKDTLDHSLVPAITFSTHTCSACNDY